MAHLDPKCQYFCGPMFCTYTQIMKLSSLSTTVNRAQQCPLSVEGKIKLTTELHRCKSLKGTMEADQL